MAKENEGQGKSTDDDAKIQDRFNVMFANAMDKYVADKASTRTQEGEGQQEVTESLGTRILKSLFGDLV